MDNKGLYGAVLAQESDSGRVFGGIDEDRRVPNSGYRIKKRRVLFAYIEKMPPPRRNGTHDDVAH
jgi:hypothetical protein